MVSRAIVRCYGQLMVRPPLTLTVCPVMNAASSEAKKATALARSPGCPRRRKGMALVSDSRSFGLSPPIEANNAVSVGPGQTQLALTLKRAISRAIVLVKAITPPLAAEYTASPDEPTQIGRASCRERV